LFELSDSLGDPPPDPSFLASLGALSRVELHHCFVVDLFGVWTGPKDVLVDPPPDPRFLASLGALSWVELHCFVVDLSAVKQYEQLTTSNKK